MWDIIGRSLVLHEKEDDFSTTDPHGNAGKGYGGFINLISLYFARNKIFKANRKIDYFCEYFI